ncbi:O-methyltransferase [Pedobacter sp. AW1-32]|uniref:O-methyltransferase n=1 Tax=Pedobacter sp. AW1-32 TaxID=3383026 RepID=UPI003FEDB730
MTETINQFPKAYWAIDAATKALDFDMASDVRTGSLLKTLASSKPSGRFLELGTGTGLSTSWILEGMDENSTLVSIDHDDTLLQVAQNEIGTDTRLTLLSTDGEKWITENKNEKFDYIFADTWHGKYLLLDEVLQMLNPGAFYIIDDMEPQPNWPDGHDKKAEKLINDLSTRADLNTTKQVWASGIVIGVKIK